MMILMELGTKEEFLIKSQKIEPFKSSHFALARTIFFAVMFQIPINFQLFSQSSFNITFG
jgi:hypothetical protein